MSDVIETAIAALSDKIDGGIDGCVKFQIEGEGGIIIDGAGVRAGEDDADVTLKADADTFQAIMSGELNPTNAFMTGKLSVDGDMGMAMKLGTILS